MKRYCKYLHSLKKQLIFIIVAAMALIPLTSIKDARAAGLLIADGGFGGVLEIKEHIGLIHNDQPRLTTDKNPAADGQ